MPSGCGGEELLGDWNFTGAAHTWGVYAKRGVKTTVQWSQPGAIVEVEEHPHPHKYDSTFWQKLKLQRGFRYSFCVQAGTVAASGATTNALRFAVDGGKELGYRIPGGVGRKTLRLKPGHVAVECFNFELDKGDDAYPGRVVIEFGSAVGEVGLCQASLRRCGAEGATATARASSRGGAGAKAAASARPAFDIPTAPTEPAGGRTAPRCPATVEDLPVHSCTGDDLSGELLSNPGFHGMDARGAWKASKWRGDAAEFFWGPDGALVDVKNQNDNKDYWAVGMVQLVNITVNPTDAYEVCVQAGAAIDGATIRFAVDRGGNPDYSTPGGLERVEMQLRKSLTANCFRFGLSASHAVYSARIAIELGKVAGQVAVCQVSLRSCRRESFIAEALPAVRRCYLAPLQAASSCKLLEEHGGVAFRLNAAGQETDGKRACLDRLRRSGGDTFVFAPGRCEIWICKDRDGLVASSTGEPGSAQVYSQLCEYQEGVAGRLGALSRSPVFVKLWEWSFTDIARECETFLGPNGFDAVQVMPVTEHVLGGAWTVKYQPVSMLLNSRSGSADEFRCMVATCRAAGVEVIADVVLNHMAEPCAEVGGRGSEAVMPCRGWAGSKFGNRRMGDAGGRGAVGPEHFHHLPADKMSNCPVDTKTFTCLNSTPPGDCTQCDLFGLPDWNSELLEVQDFLSKHLKELHSIGVTMLRVDAASYMHPKHLSKILNQVPWDYVFQEWWAGIPAPSRTRYVGAYRDIFYGRQLNKVLILQQAAALPKLLNITEGLEGLDPQQGLWPLTFHDQRSRWYRPETPTYKGGMEFHLQQKFLLATPAGMVVRLWGGFGWTDLDDGPPGCKATTTTTACEVQPVYDASGTGDSCIPTPTETPLGASWAESHRWACEHRWAGVAGLIDYRKACRGLVVHQTFTSQLEAGKFGFKAGDTCFVALWKNVTSNDTSRSWSLEGLAVGLPEGRYCDLASLPTRRGWDGQSCPNEVLVDAAGSVTKGAVPKGDLLAIHAGARLPIAVEESLKDARPSTWTTPEGVAKACAADVLQETSAARPCRPRSALFRSGVALVAASMASTAACSR